MKKKKGFTLVELLGIIIIIAIIALIGVPSVVEIINSAKEGTMKQSVRNIIHTAETLYKEEMLENGGKTPKIKFEDLTYKGEQFEYGSLSYNKDQTANVAVWKNGTCAYKTSSDKDVVLTKDLSEEECLAKGNNKLIVNKDYMLIDGITFKDKIGEATEFVFTDIEVPTGVTTEDLSTTGNGKVLGWLDGTTYYVSSGVEGQVIYANASAASMFYNCKNLTSIDLSNLNTSQTKGMFDMFRECNNLITLNVENFDTSEVTSMSNMFHSCYKLTALDLSSFDTSNVTYMAHMFYYCKNLTTLDVSNFDTSKVTNMSNMFGGCENLTTLNLNSFDTSKVTDMAHMFYYCKNLTTLDVSNFDTSNVTDMSGMFKDCENLTSIDVSNLDTSQTTNMRAMFSNCRSLTILDVSNFDTSKVIDMSWMFGNCSNLTILNVNNFDTSNVTDMFAMFFNCNELTTLDISNFDTSKVTDMSSMFSGARYSGDSSKMNLTIIYIGSKWSTTNVTSSNEMFKSCIKLPNFNSSYVDKTKAYAGDGGYLTLKS